jgi:hypothetical protein
MLSVLNPDLDPGFRGSGYRFLKEIFEKILILPTDQKNCKTVYLFLGLHEELPSYKRIEHPALQT